MNINNSVMTWIRFENDIMDKRIVNNVNRVFNTIKYLSPEEATTVLNMVNEMVQLAYQNRKKEGFDQISPKWFEKDPDND